MKKIFVVVGLLFVCCSAFAKDKNIILRNYSEDMISKAENFGMYEEIENENIVSNTWYICLRVYTCNYDYDYQICVYTSDFPICEEEVKKRVENNFTKYEFAITYLQYFYLKESIDLLD